MYIFKIVLNKPHQLQFCNCSFSDLSSQISVHNINIHKNKPSKSKIKSTTESIVNKNKSDKDEKHGMDIRDCMALASGKARLIIDVRKEDTSLSQSVAPQSSFSNIKSLPDVQSEKIISKSMVTEVSNELNCIFCKEGVDLMPKKSSENLGDHSTLFTPDQLSLVDMFVKDISKEVILSINILGMFSNINTYTSRDMGTNISVLKQNLELSHIIKSSPADDLKEVNSLFEFGMQTPHKTKAPEIQKSQYINKKIYDSEGVFENVPNTKSSLESVIFDVNDIFENEFESPSKLFSSCKSANSNLENEQSIRSDLQPKIKLHCSPNKNYFNLDDIFNEDSDDLPFPNLTNTTKTSTPISSKKIPTKSTGICSDMVTSTTKEIQVPYLTRDNRSITQTTKECSSNKVLKIVHSHKKKNVFKVPQIKFKPELFKSPTNVNNIANENKIPSPLSPILSGQISTEPSVNELFNQSVESPILSGQIRNRKPTNFPNKSRIECRALFDEDKSFKKFDSCNDFSLLCEPLDSSKIEKDMSIENNKHILSASQLFDNESTEENKNDTMEHSPMYTITQMVNKVSALAKNTESKDLKQSHIKTEKTSAVDWGSFEEDYLLDNIDLENLSNETTRPSINMKPQGNISTTNDQSRLINNSLNFPVECKVGLTPLVTNQSVSRTEILDHSTSWSTTPADEEIENCLNKTVFNEDSLITSRWLSCMKSPIHESKNDRTPLGQKTPTDSDSNSDVFQSPVSRKRSIMPGKTGKAAKKVCTACFL